MKMKERVARAICGVHHEKPHEYIFQHMRECYTKEAKAAIKAMHEPDPNAVAKAADQLNMDATKVAAVWMIMIEEMSK